MRLLLDSHVLIWAVTDSGRLSTIARTAITDPSNEKLVSAATIWEMTIKANAGRLKLPGSARDFTAHAQRALSAQPLPVLIEHALATNGLPAVHRDPFDRLLVAQALHEGLVIVSHDSNMSRYPASVLW